MLRLLLCGAESLHAETRLSLGGLEGGTPLLPAWSLKAAVTHAPVPCLLTLQMMHASPALSAW